MKALTKAIEKPTELRMCVTGRFGGCGEALAKRRRDDWLRCGEFLGQEAERSELRGG